MPRIEKDSIGKVKVPSNAYHGIFTERALNNFNITGISTHKELYYSIALIKIAAARANKKLKLLSAKKANAIERAGKEFLKGKFDDELLVDSFQAGAGTATHMNVNEVLANRASELLGKKKGSYFVHPNNDVNMGQSTNNVFPTAMRLASLALLKGLTKELKALEKALDAKSKEFKKDLKVGRTHLQDAVPITLGQEFQAYKESVSRSIKHLKVKEADLREVGIGGTAVGTEVTAHPKFDEETVKELSKLSKEKLKLTHAHVYLTNSSDAFLDLSSELTEFSLKMVKICNDLTLMGSGPRTGFNELILPEVEPGSSIMPGKVNPSIVEAFKMACVHVIGNHETIKYASGEGQLELNTMTPVIAFSLLNSLKWLANATKMFTGKCVTGLKANKKALKRELDASLSTATLLNPYLGYQNVAKLVKMARKRNTSVHDVIIHLGLMTNHELDKVLSVHSMTHPKITDVKLIERIQSRKAFKKLNKL